MKNFKFIFAVALMAAFVSCKQDSGDDPVYSIFDATVTFRPQADGKYYLRQDDSTALIVVNESMKKYPFKEGVEKRAVVRYGIDKNNPGTNHVDGYKNTWDVQLMLMDTTYIKSPVVYDKSKEDEYGNDYIGLYLGDNVFPTTMIEDGYLCVSFAMPNGRSGVVHTINLLTGVADDPYTVELRHNAYGDMPLVTDSHLINFPLKSLPDTGGKTVKLTLKWNSLAKEDYQTVTFDYCSRKDW